jgi:hypothetical protein
MGGYYRVGRGSRKGSLKYASGIGGSTLVGKGGVVVVKNRALLLVLFRTNYC